MRPHASILIIEDDKAIRDELADLLRDQGFKIAVAANGAEAMRWLEKGLQPSAILLDLVMPVMDGWAFREKQLADPRFAGIPVVLVSGTTEAEEAIEKLRVLGVVPKPYSIETLLDLLDECGTRPITLPPPPDSRHP